MAKKENNLENEIYLDIKSKIITGEFSSGMRLEENSLQSLYSCGRSTVREILKRLSGDGLVAFVPYKGASVIKITKEQCMEMLQVSEVIAGLACKLVIQKGDPNDIKQLEQLLLETEAAAAQGDIMNYLQYSTAFHEYILTACGNTYLADVGQKIDLLGSIYRNRRPFGVRMTDAAQEHRLIFEAICSGDPDKGEQAMRTHMQNSRLGLSNYRGD